MQSVWKAETELPKFPALSGGRRTDVLIIGGGIAGILTAYLLRQSGVDCILAEKGRICSGTTGNTTAKITVQHGLIYDKLLQSGKEKAEKYLAANQEAFDRYASLCAQIDCRYECKDNFVYATKDRAKLEKELRALEILGCPANFCETIPLPLETVGAIRFPGQAQFDPLKFLSAIAKDLPIFENTFVRELVGTTAVTENGRIHAEKIIAATHFPFINKHGSYFLKLYQHRSYVLALENAQDVGGMYVDEDRSGLSFRNYGNLLLLGGGGHRTGKDGGNWNELRAFAAHAYPDAEERYAYAAQDCMSLDDVPYIGNYAKSTPDFFTATGFCKWGMTGAMVAAMLLTDAVLGKDNAYADVFSPSRGMMKPQLLVNGFEAVKNLLTPYGRRCPHLGCALKWNSAEHSWDCPCHGSRFAEDGKVLDNPANGNLG